MMENNMNTEKIKHHLTKLEEKHWHLNKDIDLMERSGKYDDVEIQNLKKERLHLKDEIVTLKEQLEKINEA